jgi:hypothetical protein
MARVFEKDGHKIIWGDALEALSNAWLKVYAASNCSPWENCFSRRTCKEL